MSRVVCDYCGRAIRAGTQPKDYRYADGTRVQVHATCYHRMTAGDGCGCDLCTGDVHGG